MLFVCTANQGRSPMAEFLLRARLEARGLDGDVTVTSAGLMEGGVAVSPPVVEALRHHGVDLSAHRSRQISAAVVDAAALVLAMATEHAAEVVACRRQARARAFTLKELVRGVERVGPRRREQPLAAYLEVQDRLRGPAPGPVPCPPDDVADPYGRPISAIAATAAEIDGLLRSLVAHLWPPGAD